MNSESKSPSASASQMVELVLPNNTNTMNSLFGGKLLEWIDMVATLAAKRHCRSTVVTASIDKVDFLNPARVGDIIELNSSVNRAFITSMEVGVKVYVEDLKTGIRKQIASAYLTVVAVDNNGKPSPVPPILPENAEEIRRYEEAEKRRTRRKKNL